MIKDYSAKSRKTQNTFIFLLKIRIFGGSMKA